MEIFYYYKNIKLGSLKFVEASYVYDSFLANERDAKEKYLTMQSYRLFGSVGVRSDKLFAEFMPFFVASKREDLKDKADIMDADSDFVALYKLAQLRLNYDEFNIRVQ